MKARYWKEQVLGTIAIVGLVAVLWGISMLIFTLLSMVLGIK